MTHFGKKLISIVDAIVFSPTEIKSLGLLSKCIYLANSFVNLAGITKAVKKITIYQESK